MFWLSQVSSPKIINKVYQTFFYFVIAKLSYIKLKSVDHIYKRRLAKIKSSRMSLRVLTPCLLKTDIIKTDKNDNIVIIIIKQIKNFRIFIIRALRRVSDRLGYMMRS